MSLPEQLQRIRRKAEEDMNLLEIIIIAVIVLLAVSGFRKGFVKKLAAMVSLVLSVVLVSALLPYITEFLKNDTPVYSYITEQCRNVIAEQAVRSMTSGGQGSGSGNTSSGTGAADTYRSMGREQIKALMEENGYDSSIVDALSDEQLEQYKEQYIRQYLDQYLGGGSDNGASESSQNPEGQLGRIEQTEMIEQLPLPETLKDLLLEYNNEEGYKGLNVSTFQDYIVNFIATGILNVLAFLVSILVVQFLLWAVFTALNIVSHIPVIGFVNRVAGLLLGLLQALFLLWAAFLILSLVSGTQTGMAIMDMVEKSEFLSRLYESNLFLDIALRASAFFTL